MKKRRFLYTAIAGGTLIAACIVAAIGSGWLGRLVCHRIIFGLATATEGHVAVQSSHFEWRHLTAELDGVSVSRAGAKGASSFLRADRMRLRFGVVSILKRKIDLASLVVVRPKINFALAPHRPFKPVHMSIHHFQIVDGVFQAALGRFNLTAGGDDLNASIALESAQPRYDIAVSARHVSVGSAKGDADLRAQFGGGQLTIKDLLLSTDDGSLEARGVVRDLARPDADLSVHAQIHAAALGRISGADGIKSGNLDLSARVHYDPLHSWAVNGRVSGREIGGRFRDVRLKDISFNSDIAWRPGEAHLSGLTISTAAGKLEGTATLQNGRDFDFDGRVDGAGIQEVSLLLASKPLNWNGTASGRIHLQGVLNSGDADFNVSSAIRILPAAGKIPVSGNIRFVYHSRGAAIRFATSQLQLPQTQLAFSGSPRGVLQVSLESENLNDLQPVLANAPALKTALPDWLARAGISFSGRIAEAMANPRMEGNFTLERAILRGQIWGPVRGHLVLSSSEAKFSQVVVGSGGWHATGTASAGLENWTLSPESPLQLNVRFAGINLAKAVAGTNWQSRISAGTISGSVHLAGAVGSPSGVIQIGGHHIVADGERLDSMRLVAQLGGNQLRIEHARFVSGKASATVSGIYRRAENTWTSGALQVKIDSSGFPVTKLLSVRQNRFGLTAFLQAHGTAAARVVKGTIEPANADGVLSFRDIRVNGARVGSAKVVASTNGTFVQAKLSGEILKAPVSGTLHIDAEPGVPIKGELHLGRISLAQLAALARPAAAAELPVSGWMEGGVDFDGPLGDLHQLRAMAHVDRLQVVAKLPGAAAESSSNGLAIRNVGAIVFDIQNGVAKVRSFHLGGEDTGIAVLGSIPCSMEKPMDITVGGSADLRIFELFDSRVRAAGQSLVSASIRGTLSDPQVEGTLDLKNGSFFLANLPNGLTDVNGTVSFNRDRATIRKLTAHSGGGDLNLGGFVSFGSGPLVYNLLASAQEVRIRPAGSLSITANGSLRLSGTSDNSLLSGTVSVSHIVLNPNSDWGGLLASLSAPVPAPSNTKDFISGLQFDVHVVSAPSLQLSSSLGRDLETQVDLRLRGTPNQPVLLGTISANQGEVRIFGTTYTINHAGVQFTNPVEIEPAIDLDLQTQAHGVTVNITAAGPLNKLNINYRSDPPLQPRDIIALLAIGEAPGAAAHVVNAPTSAETAALESSANTVLGEAINPESGRLSKLFGITNIKIDPLAQGSTVTPESRLTIQQQISRNITVTYVTNLAQTSEQIFRLEWALGRQYSVIAERDDNGEFGIDIQYKKRF